MSPATPGFCARPSGTIKQDDAFLFQEGEGQHALDCIIRPPTTTVGKVLVSYTICRLSCFKQLQVVTNASRTKVPLRSGSVRIIPAGVGYRIGFLRYGAGCATSHAVTVAKYGRRN